MACTAITDYVARETDRFLPGAIRGRVFGNSPWMDLTARGVFPQGLSQTIHTLQYERTVPTTATIPWTAKTVSDGQEGGLCLPATDKIAVAHTTRDFSLYGYAVEGPDFCAENFRSVFELQAQLNEISKILAGYTKMVWEITDRYDYFLSTQYKVVVADCPPLVGTANVDDTGPDNGYPAVQATYPISMAHLYEFGQLLRRDGASESALAMSNGRPLLTVIASGETIDNLIRQNAEERQDIRWADAGKNGASMLLQRYGVVHQYRGFIFIEDLYPRRFTYQGGVYTEVAAFDVMAATKGNKAILRSAWLTAPYEETVIFDPTTYTQLVPSPITNPAPNFRFNPVNYVGDWAVKNIPDRVCNPDENILYHRGVFNKARQAVAPERGVAFVHLRCNPAGCVSACAS